VFEDSVAILTEGRLVTVDGLGALLWDVIEMDGPCTTATLLETLTSLLGDDPQAATHLETALSSLRDGGAARLGGVSVERGRGEWPGL